MRVSRVAITKFEIMNKISVNFYYLRLKNNQYYCELSRLTKNKEERHINLLLIQNKYFDKADEERENNEDDNVNLKFYCVWIKNVSALIKRKIEENFTFAIDVYISFIGKLN